MTDEQTNKADTKGTQTPEPVAETKELNPLFTEAKSLAERIEEGNRKSEELLLKQERLLAEQRLSGTSGGNKNEEAHEETPKEYAARILAGKI